MSKQYQLGSAFLNEESTRSYMTTDGFVTVVSPSMGMLRFILDRQRCRVVDEDAPLSLPHRRTVGQVVSTPATARGVVPLSRRRFMAAEEELLTIPSRRRALSFTGESGGPGGTEYPVVESYATASSGSTSETSAIGSAPSGVVAGSLLVAFLSVNGATGTVTPPSGWTAVKSAAITEAFQGLVFWKITDSSSLTESDLTFTLPSNRWILTILRISGHHATNPIVDSECGFKKYPSPSGAASNHYYADESNSDGPVTTNSTYNLILTQYTDNAPSTAHTRNGTGFFSVSSSTSADANLSNILHGYNQADPGTYGGIPGSELMVTPLSVFSSTGIVTVRSGTGSGGPAGGTGPLRLLRAIRQVVEDDVVLPLRRPFLGSYLASTPATLYGIAARRRYAPILEDELEVLPARKFTGESLADTTAVTVRLSSLTVRSKAAIGIIKPQSINLTSLPVKTRTRILAGTSNTVALNSLPVKVKAGIEQVSWSFRIKLSPLKIKTYVQQAPLAQVILLSSMPVKTRASAQAIVDKTIYLSSQPVQSRAATAVLFDLNINLPSQPVRTTAGQLWLSPNHGPSAKVYQESLRSKTLMGITSDTFKLNKTAASMNFKPIHLGTAKVEVAEVYGMFTITPALPLDVDEFYYESPGQYLLIRNDSDITVAIVQDGDTEEITLTPEPMLDAVSAFYIPGFGQS